MKMDGETIEDATAKQIENLNSEKAILEGNVDSVKRTLGEDGWMKIDKG
jgi:hypothetical protein